MIFSNDVMNFKDTFVDSLRANFWNGSFIELHSGDVELLIELAEAAHIKQHKAIYEKGVNAGIKKGKGILHDQITRVLDKSEI